MVTAKDDNTSTPSTPPKSTAPKTEFTEPAENTGAISAEQQAVRTGVSSDALNPAYASPEAQEQIKKDWQDGAKHTVDAEQVLKDAKGGKP